MTGVAPDRRLKVLGGAVIEVGGDPLGGPAAHRHRIALLAVLARSKLPVSRDKLIALLWPERDTDSGRNLLKVAVHGLRKVLGDQAIRSVGDQLTLDPALVTCDAADFEHAIATNDLAGAADRYGGPFLDGFFLKDSTEFDQWVESERAQLDAAYARAVEQLGALADARGEAHTAARWYRTLAAHDPLRADVAMRLMRALAATGDAQAAVRHASVYASLREGAGLHPDKAIAQLARELAAAPTAPPPAAPYESVNTPSSADAPSVVETHAVETTHAVPATLPLGRRGIRFYVGFAASIAVAAIVILSAARMRDASASDGGRAIDPSDVVAIFPFRVSGADPSLAYLRDGLAELLAAEFAGQGAPSALDPGTVERGLARGGNAARDPDRTSALALGRQLGAGKVLMGIVVGTPQHMTVTASMVDVKRGDVVGSATMVEGSADSLPKIIGAVAAHLLSRDDGTWRLSEKDPGTTSADALRAFVDGRAAYRAGRFDDAFRAFARALDADSTFVLDAYWLTVNGKLERPLSEAVSHRAAQLAWAGRSRLGPDRREILEAMIGARGPDVPETYEDFLLATQRTSLDQPMSPEVWALLGDLYFHRGSLSGDRQWEAHARTAFEHSLALDTSLGPASHLASIAYRDGDLDAHAHWTALLERLAPDHGYTLREKYAAAVAGTDRATVRAARERWVRTGDVYRDTYDGFPWAVGILPASELDSLVDALARLARTDEERSRAVYFARSAAISEGRPARSDELARQVGEIDTPGYYFGLLNSAEGDSIPAERLARLATSRSRADYESRCGIALSRLRRADTTGARHTATELRVTGIPEYYEAPVCASLIEDFVVAVSPSAPRDARIKALKSADSLVRTQPVGMPSIWNYDVAVAFARIGDYRSAAAAASRRQIPRSSRLAISLRDEGRWALQAGDTTEALAALKRYLLFRGNAEPSLRAEVDDVRAEVARLESSRKKPRHAALPLGLQFRHATGT